MRCAMDAEGIRARLRLALRNVLRHRGRSLLTMSSIAFGVIALVLAGGFIEDTVVEVGESMIHSWSGHLQVSRQGYAMHGTQSPERYLMDSPEALRATLAATPGVDDVMLRIAFNGLLGNGRAEVPVMGEGVEPAREAKLGHYLTVSAGRALNANDHTGVMLGQGVARALGVGPGDPVTLLVSTAGGAANAMELDVVGVFQTFSKDYDARALRISLDAARELLDTRGAHVAVVALKRTADTLTVAGALRAALTAGDRELRTWVELNDFYTQTVELYRQQFGFLVAVILLMLVLGVSNTVQMNVFERASEFGTMRALGNRSSEVFWLIVTEGVLLGVAGSAAGVALGAALAVAISAVGIPMPPPPNADMGYLSRILVVPQVMALSFAVGVAAALCASVLQARRASRMDIAEALRQGV